MSAFSGSPGQIFSVKASRRPTQRLLIRIRRTIISASGNIDESLVVGTSRAKLSLTEVALRRMKIRSFGSREVRSRIACIYDFNFSLWSVRRATSSPACSVQLRTSSKFLITSFESGSIAIKSVAMYDTSFELYHT